MPISIELPDEDLRLEFDDSYSNQQIADFIKRAPWKGEEDPKYLAEAEQEDMLQRLQQQGAVQQANQQMREGENAFTTALAQKFFPEALDREVSIPEFLKGAASIPSRAISAVTDPLLDPILAKEPLIPAPESADTFLTRLQQHASEFTTPKSVLSMYALGALGPEAVVPAGLTFGTPMAIEGAEEIMQGKVGPGAADVAVGGLMAGLPLLKKGAPYAVHEEGPQLPSGMRPRYEAEQAGVKVPAEVSGEAPRIGGGKETLAEEAQILLTPDEAELLERAALDAPEPIKTEVKVAEVGSSDDPFATIRDQRSADYMTIDPENNRIIVRAQVFGQWLDHVRKLGLSEDQIKEAIASDLTHEEIHLKTPPGVAEEYWRDLSRFEQWINRNRYSTQNKDLTDTQLGQEALRFRIQEAQQMTPSEYWQMTRTQRWTWKGLTALEKAVRYIRENFTKEGQAARALYDRALANIKAAKNVHVPVSATDELPASRQRETQEDRSRYDDLQKQISGLVQSGKFEGNELQNLWRESEAIKNKYGGMPPPTEVPPAARARQYTQEDFYDKGRIFATGPDKLDSRVVMPDGSQFYVQFPRRPEGVPVSRETPTTILERAYRQYISQSPAARIRQPELALEKMKPGEEREAVTTATPIQFEREAYRYLTDESSRVAEEFRKGGKPKPPTFADFTKQLKVSSPGIQPGATAELWERNVWRRLFNADGQTLSAFRRSLGLEKKLGDRAIVDTSKPLAPKAPGSMGIPGREELPGLREEALARREASKAAERGFRAGQRYRTRVITEIGMAMMKDAEEHIRLVTTKEISPEDIRITGGKNYSGFEALGPDIVNHRPTLEAALTDNAAVFGGRFRKPESVTKRLTVLVNKITGKVDMVSTYRSPTSGVMLRDPTLSVGKAHRPLDSILKMYQPIYSVLLDKPVKNFRQSFENLADFNQRFGNDARSRVETEGPTELPIPQELEPTEGAWEAGGPVQDAEAGALLDSIISEAGKLESPQDVIDAIPPLIIAGKALAGERLTPTAGPARQAISALRKLGLEIDRKYPGLDNESWTQRLANQIYETHKNAPSYEAFVARIIEQGGGRSGEFVPAPQIPQPAAGTVEVGRPRQKIVSKPGRAYTAEEWQKIVRERERITKEPPPAARARGGKEGRFGYLLRSYITDPAKGFGNAYSAWLTDRIAEYGGKAGQRVAETFNTIASRVKEIEGDNRDVFDKAKVALSGGRDVPGLGQVPSLSGIRATKWLSQWEKQWTPNTATARIVSAIEGTSATPIPGYVQRVIDPARDANLRAGQLVQPVTPGFTPSNKFERHLTARGYDLLKAGLDNPTTREWAKGMIAANKGMTRPVVKYFRDMHAELAKDVPDIATLDKINQDFVRRFPRVVTHVRSPAGWFEVVHTQPYNYIENTIRRAAYIRAFRESFPLNPLGKKAFAVMNDEMRKALPPEHRGAWSALLKLSQGMPADSYNSFGWLAPGKGWSDALHVFNQTIVRSTVARVLTGQMVTQVPEVALGGTAKMFGARTALESTLRLPEYWDTAEAMGQVNRPFLDWGYDVHSPIRSMFKIGSNLLSKAFGEQFLNELQGRQNAIAAQVVTSRILNDQLSRWEKRRLPETFRMMGFSPDQVAKMMRGDTDLLAQMQRKAPAWLSTENRLMSEGSTLATNRLFNSAFRFSAYPMMKLNQFRRAWGRLSDARTGPERAVALEGLARELFYTTGQGAALTLLASLMFGGPTGAAIKLHEAKDEPFKFLFESFLASMGGPLYMVYEGARRGGLLGIGEGAAQMLFPYSTGRDLLDLMQGNGIYRDMDFADRLLKHAQQKTPGMRLINGALAMSGLKEDYLPLEQSIRGYRRWAVSEFGKVDFNPQLKDDERAKFRTAMRAADRALQQGDTKAVTETLGRAFREGAKLPPGKTEVTPEQRIAQSLKARKILRTPQGKELTYDQMRKVIARIGEQQFQRLVRYDAMLDNLAESIWQP